MWSLCALITRRSHDPTFSPAPPSSPRRAAGSARAIAIKPRSRASAAIASGWCAGVWRACVGEEPEAPPAYAPDWAEATGEESLANAALRHLIPVACENFAAGDVLLFRWRDGYVAKHVAIAASQATMIHAHDGASVCEVAIAPWWRRRLAYAFAFPGSDVGWAKARLRRAHHPGPHPEEPRLRGVSKDGNEFRSILRDARKSALLRMRAVRCLVGSGAVIGRAFARPVGFAHPTKFGVE